MGLWFLEDIGGVMYVVNVQNIAYITERCVSDQTEDADEGLCKGSVVVLKDGPRILLADDVYDVFNVLKQKNSEVIIR